MNDNKLAAIDTLIRSIQTDIQVTDTPLMKTLLGPVTQNERLKIYNEMLTRALYHKRRNK